jgi:D-xylose transport system substrate-binding protein
MSRLRLAVVAAAAALMAACGGGSSTPAKKADTGQIKIGVLMAQLREERWQRDRDLIAARIEELHAKADVQSADSDAAKQLEQAKAMLADGVKALIVVPVDLEKAADIVKLAAEQHVPVISYDRLISNADVALYVSFDNTKVGRMQAERLLSKAATGNYLLLGGSPSDYNAKLVRDGQMEVLKPAVDSGAIKIVADPFIDNWDPVKAKAATAEAIKKAHKLAAVVASNDSTAGGAVQALTDAKMDGKVLVSGQDAELAACQRIVAGTQEMTVYKPLRSLARMAAGSAVSLAKGQPVSSLVKVNNGLKDIPASLIDPISVDKGNLDVTVIADGYHTRDEVYKK